MQVAVGHTVTDHILDKAFLSWEDVSGRIHQLLDQGEYAPQSVLDAARSNAVKEHAQALAYMKGDMAEGVAEIVFDEEDLPHLRSIYPEITDYLEEKLDSLAAKYDFITDRRGMGLMQGLVFDRPVAPLINAALENGLILINAGTNIIRFVPPLVITDADVDEMIEILDSCLKTFQEQNA